MEKEKNIILTVNQNLKVIIYIIIKLQEKYIQKKNWNMMVNLDMIENGMEKDMMKMII